MRTKLMRSKFLLLCMTFGLLLAIPAIAFAQDLTGSTSPAAPTIQSDLPDYAPGDTVTLTGSNWQPGESVHINVNDDQTQTWSRDVDVTADASGNITDQFQLPTTFAALYNVTATGVHSGVATASFTDGNVTVRARAGSTPLAVEFPANSSVKRYDNKTCTDPSAQSNVRAFTTNGSNNAIYTSSEVTADNTQSVSLTAPSPVTISGTPYPFSGWTADSPSELQVVSSTGTTSCITRGPSSSNNPVWNITANYTDTTAPQVVSIDRTNFSPTNDSQVSWRVTFSEHVTGVSTGDFSPVNTGLGGTPAITSGGSGAVWIVTASTGSGDGTLGLNLVDDDTIVDGSGNMLGGAGGAANGSFTGQEYKIDRTAPTVTAVVPTENADNVDIGTNVSATFSEDMGTSVVFSGLTFTLKLPNGNTVTAARTHNAATNTATLNPSSNLANNTTYTATITTAARDLAGNPLATAKTWTFTTAPACTAPSVTTQPGPQSITYGANASFTAAANGTSPTVKWQKSTDNGANWTDISGASSTTLTLTKPSVSDSNSKYRAVFTNACGSATSNGSATLQVAQKNLTISGAIANDKSYDGNTNATVNFSGASLDGIVVGGDMDTISSSGNDNFANAQSISGTTLSVSGTTQSATRETGEPDHYTSNPADAGLWLGDHSVWYRWTAPSSGSTTIDTCQANIDSILAVYTGTALTSLSRVADNNNDFCGGGWGSKVTFNATAGTTYNIAVSDAGGLRESTFTLKLVAPADPDMVTIDSSGYSSNFDNKNVGNNKAVTVTGVTLGGADAGNYTVSQPSDLTANITARDLTGSFTAHDKEYDSTTAADVLSRSVNGKIDGDDVSLDGSTATFENKNVGQNKTVTLSGASLTGSDAGNYNLTSVSDAQAAIMAKDVTGSFTAKDKEYDSTRTASVDTTSLPGVISGDTVNLVVSNPLFDTKDVGTGKDVTGSLSLTGTDAGNYTVNASHTTKADITAKEVTSSFTADNKTYDGNTDATIATRSVSGEVSGDDVSLDGGTATFGTANAGQGKTVTGTGFTLSGAQAGNYKLASTTLTTTADIDQKELTGSFNAANKTYDANTSATVDTRSLPGVIGTDEVNLDVTNAQFDNKNAGNGKTVSADLALSGAEAGNYSLSSNTAMTTANITAKELTGSFTAENKTYEGNTSATITNRSVTGKVGSDDVSLNGGSATFGTASADTGKTVTGTGFTLAGADKGNYTLKAGPWTTTADINPATLTVTAANQSKRLGDPNPTFTASHSGFVNGEDESVLGGSLTFATNVPNPEQVGTWDITPSGLTSSNYIISFVKGTLTITSITYKFDGFRSPVDNPGTSATPVFNSAKAGQSIPVKFSLFGNQGLDIIAGGNPKVTSVNCVTSATVDPIEEYATSTANGGLTYDATANQYNYVWKTQSTYANKCFKFDLVLKDGTSHVAFFKFLK
jgi:trimeric autotransporter adhesin